MKGTKHKRKTLPEQSLIINYRLKEEAVIVGERELLPLGRVKSLEFRGESEKEEVGFWF